MHEIYLIYEQTNARGRALRMWHDADDMMPSPLDENLGFDQRLRWLHADDVASGKNWIYELEHRHDRVQYVDGSDQLDPLLSRPHLLDGLIKGNGYLMVNLSFEAAVPDYALRIAPYLERCGIPGDRVIWASGSHDAAAQVQGYGSNMRPMTVRASESMSALWLRDRINELPERHVEKRFICFMRRFRPHRFQLLAQISDRGLLPHVWLSFGREVEGQDALDTARHQLRDTAGGGDVIESIRALYDRLPFILDAVDPDMNLCETQLADSAMHHHMRSGISIVAETVFHTPYRFLSEKAYHPIRYLQPFIMVGPAGNLAALRADGYATFGEFWDESYDSIIDDQQRMIAIADLLQHICGWSDAKFHAVIRDSADICARNLELLLSCHTRRDHIANLSHLWP